MDESKSTLDPLLQYKKKMFLFKFCDHLISCHEHNISKVRFKPSPPLPKPKAFNI